MGVGGRRSIGKEIDSRIYERSNDLEYILSNPELPDVETVTFARSSTAINQIDIIFNEKEFDKLRSQFALFQTSQGPEAFNNFNFSTPELWDDIWFGENSTYIANSEAFILGKTSLDTARIPIAPEKVTKKNYVPTTWILGVPVRYKDEVKYDMDMYKVQESNVDNRIPLANKYNSTTQTILFRFDFTEKQYTFKYFMFMDILASIGGLNAFITPLVSKLIPFFVIAFLFRLAKIILDYAGKEYRDELISTLSLTASEIQKREEFDGKDALVQRINIALSQLKDLPDETDWVADNEEDVKKLRTYNEDLEIQRLIKEINNTLGFTSYINNGSENNDQTPNGKTKKRSK